MRISKTVGAVSLAFGLLVGATHVMAGPVLTLAPDGTFENVEVSSGEFSDTVKTLHLDSSRLVSAYLSTTFQKLDIRSVHLVKLDAAGTADDSTRLAFTETLAVNWEEEEGAASERWEIAPALLSAGNWQLLVRGFRHTKGVASYAGAIQTDSQIPEPQTLALSFLAIAAMAGLARRRKAVP